MENLGKIMNGNFKAIDGVMCCFCNKEIEENKTDPLDINIIYNEDMLQKTGTFRNFYAHFYCLKPTLHKDIQGYLVRTDED